MSFAGLGLGLETPGLGLVTAGLDYSAEILGQGLLTRRPIRA